MTLVFYELAMLLIFCIVVWISVWCANYTCYSISENKYGVYKWKLIELPGGGQKYIAKVLYSRFPIPQWRYFVRSKSCYDTSDINHPIKGYSITTFNSIDELKEKLDSKYTAYKNKKNYIEQFD